MNANSLLNKVDYITMFGRHCKLDVIAVSESWLVQSMASSFVALDCYSIIRGDVQGMIRKQGVCLYIKDTMRYIDIKLVGKI